MFLERVFSGKNDFGRWLAFLLVVFIAFQLVGLIPLGLLMFLRLNDNPDLEPDPENLLDFSSYEIAPVTGLAFTLLPYVFGVIALFLLIRPVHERSMLSFITGSDSFRWRKFSWGLSIWLLLLTFSTLFAILIGLQKVQLQFQPSSFFQLVAIVVLLMPVKAAFEEFFFRGYLMQGFARISLNRWAPILFSTLFYCLFQFLNPELKAFGQPILFSQVVWIGIFLGVCTIMDDGLEMVLGIHLANSLFYSIFFTNQNNAILTPALFVNTGSGPAIDFIFLTIISFLFILLTKRIHPWPFWSFLFAKIEKPFSTEEIEYSDHFGLYGEEDEEDEN